MTQSRPSKKYKNAIAVVLSLIFLFSFFHMLQSGPVKDVFDFAVEEDKKDIDSVLRRENTKSTYTFRFLVSQDDLWKRVKKMKIEITTPMFKEALDSFSTGTRLLSQGRRNRNKLNLGRAIHKLNFSAESIPTFETFYNLGYAYLAFGDYDQALMEFQKALDYDKDHPGLYTGIGMSLVHLGRVEEGLDQLHMGMSLADSMKGSAWKGEIMGRLGTIYKEKKQIDIALVYFQEAIIKNYKVGYIEGAVDSLCAYSELRIENKKGKVKQYLLTALDLAKKNGYQVGVARAATILASFYKSKGQKNEVLDFYQQALAAQMDMENLLGQAKIFNQIAKIHEQGGDFDQAIKYYHESLLLYKHINHQEGKSNDLGNIGLIYYVKGDLDQALKYYQGALVVHEEVGDQRKKSITLGNIGVIYFDKQEMDKALVYLRNALIINRRIGFKEGEALHLGHIGKAYLMSNNFDKALKSFMNSMKLYMDLENTSGEAQQLSNLGRYYILIKDNPNALKHYMDSLNTFRKVGDLEGEASQMSKIGMLYRKMGDTENSLKYLNESLVIFENIHGQAYRKFASFASADPSRQMLTID